MRSILVVEDNEMNLDMLSRRLVRYGFHVIESTDGIAGVQQARISRPDLILLDLGLPLMDGWQAARILRAGADTRNIPIVALTAHATVADRDRALSEGFDGFATKPVEFHKLLQLMNQILEKQPV